MREEEERGVYSYWSVIFKAASFEDLLGRVDFVNEIAEYNNSVIAQLRDLRKAMQEDKVKLEEQKAELDSRRQELQTQLDAAQALVTKYTETAEGYEAMEAEEQAKADSIAAQISAQRNNGSGSVVSESGYIWPSGCHYLTSNYGMRIHPIYGYEKMHTGIDIGASYGSNIYASKSGVVTTANMGWGGGYGNYVEIDHGNGNYTLYAHMSSLAVSEGEYVTQGQVIGYCGSTGNSNGPHVHFEIYENYSRLDPLTRLSGDYSHSSDWDE